MSKNEKKMEEIKKLIGQITKDQETEELNELEIWNTVKEVIIDLDLLKEDQVKERKPLEDPKKLEKSSLSIERIAFLVYKISQMIPPMNDEWRILGEKLENIATSIAESEVLDPNLTEDFLIFFLKMGVGSSLNRAWMNMVQMKIKNNNNKLVIMSTIQDMKDKITEEIESRIKKENGLLLDNRLKELEKTAEGIAKEKLEEWKKAYAEELYEQAYGSIKKDMEEKGSTNKDEIINLLMT